MKLLSLPSFVVCACVAVCSAGARAQLPAAAGPFVDAGVQDGVKLEAQPLTGTKFPNLRATVEIDAPPELVLTVLFGTGAFSEAAKGITSREVLVNEPARRVYYETAEAPFISTRDYILEVKKELDPASGRYALRFQTIPWPKKPESDERVRITIVGSSVITPLDGGKKSRVVQTIYSNPNGNIPAWAADGAQKKTVVDSLARLKKKAEAAHKAKG